MGFVYKIPNEEINKIARKVYDRHFEIDPKLAIDYDEKRKTQMYDEILDELRYLNIALEFDDGRVFKTYAIWIYQLVCYMMKDLDRTQIKDQMVLHYKIINDVLSETLSDAEYQIASYHLKTAIQTIENESVKFSSTTEFQSGKYIDIKKEYLELLIKNDTESAINVIDNAAKSGIHLHSLYIEILQAVMYEVGNLWHQNLITIDKEHYCTATTQGILSRFHPIIFSNPPKGYEIITCCVGSELHEMGVRMLSDLFEYHGWNSIYLGSAVSMEKILDAINENNPDLIALSVTMPQHLSLCNEIVNEIRAKHKGLKIAVGGRAFQTTDQLWKKWNVDISTENAIQLVEWAHENIIKKVNDSI